MKCRFRTCQHERMMGYSTCHKHTAKLKPVLPTGESGKDRREWEEYKSRFNQYQAEEGTMKVYGFKFKVEGAS